MKSTSFLLILTLLTANLFAQKESFDVLTYKPIKNWKKEKTDKSVSFSITDDAKGTFCIINLYISIDGDADSKTNFDNSWNKFAKEQLGAGDATMEEVTTENGWELQTGSASFDKGGLSGNAMLVTATSHTKMVNMLVLFNSETYSAQLNDFISAIELKKVYTKDKTASTASTGNNNVLVGIWAANLLETSGYMNNVPQYSGGYFRKEYTFKNDGTYFYSFKNWSVYAKTILFGYETGTWSINGNTLTLAPKEGKKGEWSKKRKTSEWGNQIKLQPMKLEKISYTFETKYFSGSQSSALYLNCGKSTERDGTYADNGFSYTLKDKAIIDFPPGLK